jgi:hypothetical protein
MKLSKPIFSVISIYLTASLLVVTCYPKTKIDLSKLVYKDDITGTWKRGGGFTSKYDGITSIYKIDSTLSFYEDGTYRLMWSSLKSYGHMQ